jgi:glyoxylase I family protein
MSSVQIRSTHHIGMVTGQFERMRRFYVEVLGLAEAGGFPEHHIVFLDAGSTRIELLGQDIGSDQEQRAGWHHLALEVDDVDAAFSTLTRCGVDVHSPPESFPPEAPVFRIAFLRDPDGNLLELIQQIADQAT